MSNCKNCFLPLPDSRILTGKGGRRKTLCDACKKLLAKARTQTPKALANRKWLDMLRRAGKGSQDRVGYSRIFVLMTKQQFMSWAIPTLTRLQKENPGQSWHLDRIDNNNGYSLSNIQFLTHAQHEQKHGFVIPRAKTKVERRDKYSQKIKKMFFMMGTGI